MVSNRQAKQGNGQLGVVHATCKHCQVLPNLAVYLGLLKPGVMGLGISWGHLTHGSKVSAKHLLSFRFYTLNKKMVYGLRRIEKLAK